MEESRRLAETVPGTLFLVAYEATAAGGLLHRAAALYAHVSAFCGGAAPLRVVAHGVGPVFGFGTFPSVLRELALLRHLHANASRSFLLSGAALGLNHDPIWRRWRERRNDTLCCTAAALRRLRAGHRLARRLVGAIVLACTFPRGSPERFVCAALAVRLATHSAVTAAMLFHAARRLRDAAIREFIEAWMVLNRDRM